MPTTAPVVFTVRRQGRRIGAVHFTSTTGWTVPGVGTFLTRNDALTALRANAGVDARDLLTYHRD